MNKIRFTLNAMVVGIILLAGVSLAQAQATRTWVSGVGDDVNPCSRTAPCKTWAGAISKTATNGEINAIDPGGFGTLNITKAITIDGVGTDASTLAAGTNGFIVNAPADAKVILRNLSINGAGTGIDGIRFLAGNSLTVENVVIDRFTSDGIEMNVATQSNLYVKNVSVSNTGTTDLVDAGIKITTNNAAGRARATIIDSSFSNNRVGINALERADVLVRNCTVQGNLTVVGSNPIGYGITAATATTMTLENCSAAHLNSGVRAVENAGGTVKVFLSNSSFTHCAVGSNAGVGAEVFTSVTNRFGQNGSDVSGSFVTKLQQ